MRLVPASSPRTARLRSISLSAGLAGSIDILRLCALSWEAGVQRIYAHGRLPFCEARAK
jgi:hypothetical protein